MTKSKSTPQPPAPQPPAPQSPAPQSPAPRSPAPQSPAASAPSGPPGRSEPPRTTRAFVDGLEAGKARLLLEDEHGELQIFHLPAAALPPDAKEGGWIELSIHNIPTPPEYDGRVLRDKLGRTDHGGNFSL